METSRLILLAVQLEERVAACYTKLSRLASSRPAVAEDLEKMSREEIVHAALLKSGEKYASDDPGLFETGVLGEADLNTFLGLAKDLDGDLEANALSLVKGLTVIRDLEAIMEKAHLGTLLKITDSSLRTLFQALADGDKDHRRRLDQILGALGIDPAPRS